MLPEKPKRHPKQRHFWSRFILAGLIILSGFFLLPANQNLSKEQRLDVGLIGIIICCLIVLVYQGILWIVESSRAGITDNQLKDAEETL